MYFNLPFKRKKGYVTKESKANKKDRYWSTPNLGQFYDKMWFGVPD